MICPHCQNQHSTDARFCPNCGNACQISSTEPSRTEQFIAVIGSNSSHYVPTFLDREAGKKGPIGWHWPAFFVTFFWMLYRKMYGMAFAYLGLSLALAYIGIPILLALFGGFGGLLALLIYLSIFIVPALFADQLYLRRCQKTMAFATRFSHNPNQQLEYLRNNGGSSSAGYIVPIVLLAASVPVLGILAAIAIPAYQDYVSRSTTYSAYQELSSISRSINHYYDAHQQMPASLAQAGISTVNSKIELALLPNGSLQATLLSSANKGKSLALQPVELTRDGIAWRCYSSDIANKHLPQPCRTE